MLNNQVFENTFHLLYKYIPYAHFVMNSVSYIDGKMFSGNRSEMYDFLEYIKKVTGDKSWIVQYGSDRDKRFEVDENDI